MSYTTRSKESNYFRNATLPLVFGESLLKGVYELLNTEELKLEKPSLYYSHPNGQIWIADAVLWLKNLADESVDLIFADPPYDEGLIGETLDYLTGINVIADEGTVIFQHCTREAEALVKTSKLVLFDQRKYGDTILSFLKLS